MVLNCLNMPASCLSRQEELVHVYYISRGVQLNFHKQVDSVVVMGEKSINMAIS